MKSVAVITATTGRDTLAQAIESVAAQTYGNVHHYVFFDGVPVQTFPHEPENYHAIPIPKPTGGNGMLNGGIIAASAYLTTEDLICFLDDDNWYDPDHIESMVEAMGDHNYAFSLRKLINPDGSFYVNDDGESIGHYGDLVDVNCYMFKRDICAGIAPLWYKTNIEKTMMVGDRYVWDLLKSQNVPFGATGRYTVNYRMGAHWNTRGYFFLRNIQKRAQYPDGFPWRKTA